LLYDFDEGRPLELQELQKIVDELITEIGGYWDDFVILARLTEELGEVARVLQREKGFRPVTQNSTANSQLPLEIGDLLFVLISLANKRNVNLEKALLSVIEKYKRRDLPKWKSMLE
jgi:NTP pyrophosphatase (non-canonical NTP hydrolase)